MAAEVGLHRRGGHSGLPDEPAGQAGPVAAVVEQRAAAGRGVVPPLGALFVVSEGLVPVPVGERPHRGAVPPLDLPDVADAPFGDQIPGLAHCAVPGDGPVHHQFHAGRPDGAGDAQRSRQIRGHGLFGDHVDAVGGDGLGHLRVARVLRAKDHHVHLFPGEHVAIVIVLPGHADHGHGALEIRPARRVLPAERRTLRNRVRTGYPLHVRHAGELVQQVVHVHVRETDDTQPIDLAHGTAPF